jgi:hypothetical protein
MKTISIVLALGLVGLASTNAISQNIQRPIITSPSPAVKAMAARNAPVRVAFGEGVSNEYLITATDVALGAAPILSDFRLWFNNGDHKVRTIGVLHEGGGMRANFSDQNGDDPFRAKAKWLVIPGATGGTISAVGGGTFNIQLPPKPANTTLVIAGFSFERQAGTDANIRTIAIKMDQENSIAQVSLIDDQREDYRGIVEPTMTGGVLGLVPFGTLYGSGLSMESIIRGILNEGRNTARPYSATIQYAYVPNARISSSGAVSGTGRQKALMQGQHPGVGHLVYRGFVMRFNNSDHHLLGMGLHINGMPGFPGQRVVTDSPITWQDNNNDDPLQWYVDYSTVN